MTFIWFIYYTVRIFKSKDSEGDALIIIPSLIIDSIIITILKK